MIQKAPGQIELLGHVRRERFDTHSLRGVMARVEHVEPQLFSVEERPVLAFTGDECVESGGSRLRDQRAARTGDDPDSLDALWSERKKSRRGPQCRSEERRVGEDVTTVV